MVKEIYYYERDQEKRPVVTVCVVQQNDEVARGVAICSPKDVTCKATGRKIAKHRAVYALNCQTTALPVGRDEAAAVSRIVHGNQADFHQFKADFNPDLTDYERELLEKKRPVV